MAALETHGYYIMTGDGDLPYLNEYRVWKSTAERIARKHMQANPDCAGQIDVSKAHNHDIVFSIYRNEKFGELRTEHPDRA